MTFGKFNAFAGVGHGQIRVPLDQWGRLVFDYNGRRIDVPVSEVFKALEEAYGSSKIVGG